MFFREPKVFIRALAFVGPIFGKHSIMYWSCSFLERNVLEGLKENSVLDFLVAITAKYDAVSSSSCVKIIGTWCSNAIDKSKPRRAFLCSWSFLSGEGKPSTIRRCFGYCFSSINCETMRLFTIEDCKSERVFLSIAMFSMR